MATTWRGRGRRQTRLRTKTVRDEAGDRVGFSGRRYRTELLEQAAGTGEIAGYADQFDDFPGFLQSRLVEARRVLTATGSSSVNFMFLAGAMFAQAASLLAIHKSS